MSQSVSLRILFIFGQYNKHSTEDACYTNTRIWTVNCLMPLRLIKLFGLIVMFTMEINSHWLDDCEQISERASKWIEWICLFVSRYYYYYCCRCRCRRMMAFWVTQLLLQYSVEISQRDRHIHSLNKEFISKSIHVCPFNCVAHFFPFPFSCTPTNCSTWNLLNSIWIKCIYKNQQIFIAWTNCTDGLMFALCIAFSI